MVEAKRSEFKKCADHEVLKAGKHYYLTGNMRTYRQSPLIFAAGIRFFDRAVRNFRP